MKTYKVETFGDDEGNIILPLPLEMLEELGWKEGTTLEWLDNGDGSFSLKKKETMLERIKSWLHWRGKSSYSAIKMNSMTKEEAAAEEAQQESAFIEPLNPQVVSEEAISVQVEAPKKVAKKKAPAKKAKKKAKKKTAPKKEK